MTREEYTQLAKNSESFKGMDKDLQEKVLKAEGDVMEHYISIFTDENKLLNEAYKAFVQDNENILTSFKRNIKNIQATKLKEAENSAVQADTKQAEELLKGINDI